MKRMLRVFLRVAALVAAAAFGIGVYCMLAGIPGPLVRHCLSHIERTQGLRIEVTRVLWRPWHNLTARGVRLYVPDGSLTAAFECVELDIRSKRDAARNPRDIRCRALGGHVVVANGEQASASIALIECDIPGAPANRARFIVDGTIGDGWDFKINGRLRRPPRERIMPAETTLAERLSVASTRACSLLLGIDSYREKGFLPGDLTARVILDIEAGDVFGSGAWVFVDGGPVRIGDLTMDQCSASVQWTNGLVRIDSLRLVSSGSGPSLEGRAAFSPESWDVAGDLRVRASPSALVAAGLLATNHMGAVRLVGALDAHVDLIGNLRKPAGMGITFHAASQESETADADLDVEHLRGSYSNETLHVETLRLASSRPMACLPAAWVDSISRAGIGSLGPLQVDMSLGPASVSTIMSNITGRLMCAEAGYRGAGLEQIAFNFRRDGSNLQITDAIAVLPGEGSPRSVTGHATVMPGGAYTLRLETDAEPELLAPLLPANIAHLAASLEVGGASRLEVDIRRAGAGTTNLAVRGTIHATSAARNEVPVDLAHASFAYSKGTLRVDDLAVVWKDGQVTGCGVYDLSDALLSVDVRSSAPPIEIARFIGPGLERALARYRFEGPAAIDAKGSIGLRGNPARDLCLHVDGSHVGWRWFMADHAVLDLVMGEKAIGVQDIRARWCGGDVSGSLRFEKPARTNTAGRCSMELQVAGAELASVVDIFRDIEDRKAYEGSLSGQIALSGETGPRFLETATGSGRVDVQDGYIFSLPLFGGLSKYLSVLIPGLGYASQRDLRSSFRIRDGRIETTDAELLGKLVTIRGKGSYAFSKDLNVRVQVLFLKEGLTATVTRLLTSPLSKALEFELTGTPKEPHWRPLNTPDRLLKFFAEKLGDVVHFGRNQNGDTAPHPEIKP